MSSRYASVFELTSSTVTFAPRPTAILHAFAPTTPPPMIGDATALDARHAAEQHALAAALALEVRRAGLHRHPAGDRAHRRQQRQIARRRLERLVRDAVDAAVEQLLAELVRRGEVEVREQQQVFAHQRELGRDRLLDLHDHVRVPHTSSRGGDDLRARLDVRLVGDRRADAGVLLDEHGVAACVRIATPAGVMPTRNS